MWCGDDRDVSYDEITHVVIMPRRPVVQIYSGVDPEFLKGEGSILGLQAKKRGGGPTLGLM